jgi:hypothetical protein
MNTEKAKCTSVVFCFLFAWFIAMNAPQAHAQNSGTIVIHFGLSHSNLTTGCFAFTNGWDKYIVVTNLFLGPNYSGTLPTGGIPNTNHCTNLVLDLCNSANGSNLVGQLYVINNFHPNDGEAKCGTNDPTCIYNTNSSTDIITMTNATDAAYRASVIYKSSTTNGLTNIAVNWAYTNL